MQLFVWAVLSRMRADVRVLMRFSSNFNTLLFVAEYFTHVSGVLTAVPARTAALTLVALINSKDFLFLHPLGFTCFYFIVKTCSIFCTDCLCLQLLKTKDPMGDS